MIILFIIGIVLILTYIVLKDNNPNFIKTRKLIVLDYESSPSLFVGNGVIGTVFMGEFERENTTSHAMYNVFMVLGMPIFPIGCYLADGPFANNSYSIHAKIKGYLIEYLSIIMIRYAAGCFIAGILCVIFHA